jgi:citrate lyase subunit beta/citryl-CoA lyase
LGPFRSFLFAPGNHPRRVEKALGLDADAVILDLEDAVAQSEKKGARAAVAQAIAQPRTGALYVRVNGHDTPFCADDLDAVVGPGLDGIVLPMVDSAEGLAATESKIAELEQARELAVGTLDLMPIIETALGHENLREIARAGTRMRRLSFGAADYTLDMGMTWTPGESELGHVRQDIVLASRVAGLEPPVDTVYVHIRDAEGLIRSAGLSRGLGFQGKLCIHPDQIALVNQVFTPTDQEVERADQIIAAFDQAEAAGSAAISVNGEFVDYPVVEKARRVLLLMDLVRGTNS